MNLTSWTCRNTHTTVRDLLNKVDLAACTGPKMSGSKVSPGFWGIFSHNLEFREKPALAHQHSACLLYWVRAVYHFNDVCVRSWNLGSAHIISLSTEVYFYLEFGLELLFKQYEWLKKDLEVNEGANYMS